MISPGWPKGEHTHFPHTNLPVGHGPRVGHPVRHIGAHTPCALRRRNRIKVGIGSARSRGKAAGFLVDSQRKATTPDWLGLAHASGGCGAIDRDAIRFVLLECHGEGFMLVVCVLEQGAMTLG